MIFDFTTFVFILYVPATLTWDVVDVNVSFGA